MRILVVGISGSGKSTTCALLAKTLGYFHQEEPWEKYSLLRISPASTACQYDIATKLAMRSLEDNIVVDCSPAYSSALFANKRDKAEGEARSLHSFTASGCCERQRAAEDLELKFLLFIWGPQTLIEIRLFNESILIIALPDFTVLA